VDPADPNLARQNPADYLKGIEATIKGAAEERHDLHDTASPLPMSSNRSRYHGSSPMPVDAMGQALCFLSKRFQEEIRRAWSLAVEGTIPVMPKQRRLPNWHRGFASLSLKIGGVYSSEWWWSKILHCKKTAPDVFEAARSWMEICDWIPAVLVGTTAPDQVKRSICAAGP